MTDEKTPIPQNVITALAYAREDGSFNMLDTKGVLSVIEDSDTFEEAEGGFDADDAAKWLRENRTRYMDALMAMGEQVALAKAVR